MEEPLQLLVVVRHGVRETVDQSHPPLSDIICHFQSRYKMFVGSLADPEGGGGGGRGHGPFQNGQKSAQVLQRNLSRFY